MLADQHAARERVWAGAEGVVLLCEHPPVITLGRSANRANVLAPGGVEVVPIERGGDVTYHGPGQLMIYPIVRLRRGVVDFLERVAAAIVDAAAVLGAPGAAWRREPAGVWVGDAKLAACGLHVARGVSVHGFALDVATPREAWARINPCGLGAPLKPDPSRWRGLRERWCRSLHPFWLSVYVRVNVHIALQVVQRTDGKTPGRLQLGVLLFHMVHGTMRA